MNFGIRTIPIKKPNIVTPNIYVGNTFASSNGRFNDCAYPITVFITVTCDPTCRNIATAPRIRYGNWTILVLPELALETSDVSLLVSISGNIEYLMKIPSPKRTTAMQP